MHYVISDIHGHTKTFLEFANSLCEDDKVFVIGDTIDKGDGTLDVLTYIMNDKRFTFLLGNHEYMLYKELYYKKKVEEYENSKLIGKNIEEKWFHYQRKSWESWSVYTMNDGERTLLNYFEKPEKEQERIFNYLANALIQTEVNVCGRNFILVHAVPYPTNKDIKLSDFNIEYDDKKIEKYIWDRKYYEKIPSKIIVTGHNLNKYTFGHSSIESDGKYDNDKLRKMGEYGKTKCIEPFQWACIDTNLAMRDSLISKLGILCLEDLSFEVRKNLDDTDRNIF